LRKTSTEFFLPISGLSALSIDRTAVAWHGHGLYNYGFPLQPNHTLC